MTQASNYGDLSRVYNGVDMTVNARFGQGGLLQQLPRPVQAQLQVELPERAAEMRAEQALELPCGDAQRLGRRRQARRLLRVAAQQLDGGQDHGVPRAVPLGGGEPLRRRAVADRLVDELVGHVVGEARRLLGGDRLQRQVDPGRAAGAGRDPARPLEQ